MRFLGSLLLAVVLLLASGCTETSPRVTQTPQSSIPRLPEADAIAIATATFERYLDLSNLIINDRGNDPSRIDAITTAAVAETERIGFEEIRASGYTFAGAMTLTSTSLQSISQPPNDLKSFVTIYACVDLRATSVTNANGESVVSASRPNTRTWEVGVGRGEQTQEQYVITQKNVWKESEECE